MTSMQLLDPDEPFLFDPTVQVIVQDLESEDRRLRAHEVLRRSLRASDALTLIAMDGTERLGVVDDLLSCGPVREVRVIPLSPKAAVRSYAGARAIVARLRGPGGCPWDREQTPESLIRYVLEEAYEVAEAIRGGAPHELADELGDLLLQVLLQSEIAQETDRFSLDDVFEALNEKLIRRHPHVFGDVRAETSAQVLQNWDQLKQAERPQPDSALDGVTKGLAALMTAQAIQRKMQKVGFDWPPGGAWHKLQEELTELREAESTPDLEHELGDVLFMVARVGLDHGIDAESALGAAIQRVQHRFRHVEQRLTAEARLVAETPIAELEALWVEAKQIEKAAGREKGDP